jgi:hypothetical protein
MLYKFPCNGTFQDVEGERWRWTATYRDGTSLDQFDDQGYFHQFREIAQDQLYSFTMSCADRELPPVTLLFCAGYKLIHFYRNAVLNFGTPGEMKAKLYCFGYECSENKVIMVITPDDDIVVVRDIDDIQIMA